MVIKYLRKILNSIFGSRLLMNDTYEIQWSNSSQILNVDPCCKIALILLISLGRFQLI